MVALLALTALAAAVVQATTGLGFALVLGPVAFALLDPEGAVLIIIVLSVALNLLVLLGERRRPRVAWGEVGPILAAAVPGAAGGVLLLRALSKPALQLLVGLLVVAAALLRVRALRAGAPEPAPGPGDGRTRLALGLVSGTLTTSAGVNGPPLALWLTRRGLGPGEVRDSLSAAFLGLSAIGVVALVPVLATGDASEALDAPLLAATLACVVVGHALGSRAFARLDARRFEPLLLAVVLAAGAASAVAGALDLAT
jgi:uncharacterized membrane protein YfcA